MSSMFIVMSHYIIIIIIIFIIILFLDAEEKKSGGGEGLSMAWLHCHCGKEKVGKAFRSRLDGCPGISSWSPIPGMAPLSLPRFLLLFFFFPPQPFLGLRGALSPPRAPLLLKRAARR